MPKPINLRRARAVPATGASGERASTSVAVAAAGGGVRQLVAVYTADTNAPGTFTSSDPTNAPILEQGSDGSGVQGFALVECEPSTGVTVSWPNATGTGGYITAIPYGPGGVTDDPGVVLDTTAPAFFTNIDNQTWPAVTPTRENQTVLCLWGYSDNTGGISISTIVAASYAGAEYFGAGEYTTLTGADAGVGWIAFRNPPVGVPFAPQTNSLPSNQAGVLCTVLLDSVEQLAPIVLASSAVYYNGAQTGNFPMPTAAQIAALDPQPGDLFVLFNASTLGRYTTIGNASWLDDQYGGNGDATDSDHCIGWKRLDETGWDAAWSTSPPTFSYQASSPTSTQGWALVRGVQITGAYAGFENNGNAGSFLTSFTIPAHGTATELVLSLFGGSISNLNWTNLPPQNRLEVVTTQGGMGVTPAALWTPGTPGTGITLTWNTSRSTLPWLSISLAEAQPVNGVVGDIAGAATIAATLTAEPGAKFIIGAIVGTALVDVGMTSRTSRRQTPRRTTVWVSDLAGVQIGAIS